MDPADIANRFTFHPATPDQARVYETIRYAAKTVAEFIDKSCPDGREKALAITHLEETVFWANASIARSAGLDVPDGVSGSPATTPAAASAQTGVVPPGGYPAGDTLVEDVPPPPDGPGIGH